jgi:membrane protease YdiL (CAAX protease family)
MTEPAKRGWSLPGLTSATVEAMAFGIVVAIGFAITTEQIRSPGLAIKAFAFTLYAAGLALIAYALRRKLGGWSWRDLGFHAPCGVWGEIRCGTVAFALYYVVAMPASLAVAPSLSATWARWDEVPPDVALPLALVLTLWPAAVTGFFTGALFEEIVHRGYGQGLFQREGSAVIGPLASWIPFSLHHYFSHTQWTFVQVLNTVFPGLFFCLAYLATRSLVAVVTAHALLNSVSIIPYYVRARESVAGSYLAFAALGVLCLLALLIGRKDSMALLRTARHLVAGARPVDVGVGVLVGVLLLLDLPALRAAKEALALGEMPFRLLLLGLAVLLLGIAAALRRLSVRT